RRRELRIEAGIGAAGAIEEFAVKQERRRREDVLEEERLAPADMSEDEVGPEASPPQRRGRGGEGLAALHGAQRARLEEAGVIFARGFVREQAYPVKPRLVTQVLLVADRHHLVAGAGIVRREVAVLAGKILVDEEQPHHIGSEEPITWARASRG